MKSTGIYHVHTEASENPSKSFINDLRTDINQINECFTPKQAREIKKELIQELLNNL